MPTEINKSGKVVNAVFKNGEKMSAEKSGFEIAREIVESVVVAFVLALMFRTYVAEAFMIPTGSMSNTLMGRHKDIYCSECGFRFKVGATDEVDRGTGKANGSSLDAVVCPNCRVVIDLSREKIEKRNHPSYDGDRIVVGKYPYRVSEPSRWDVFVFMFPGNTQTNYIKRLVGLPNEKLRIKNGDVFTRSLDKTSEDDFKIARKPPEKILAMMQNVYDNDHLNAAFYNATKWPARWIGSQKNVWISEAESYSCGASAAGQAHWLTYQHVVPTYDVLLNYYQGTRSLNEPDERPALITDMNAYNFSRLKIDGSEADPRCYPPTATQMGMHWVGDLIVECEITPQQKSGKAYLQLVKGGQIFTATINLTDGKTVLSISGKEDWRPSGTIPVSTEKPLRLRFANVDDALYLWYDDKLVEFDSATQYDSMDNSLPTPEDLRPVRIGLEGVAGRVERLKLFRDIYYIAATNPVINYITDFHDGMLPYNEAIAQDMEDFYRNPARWGVFADRRCVDFNLEQDQFFAMGDNCTHSEDSRLWGRDGVEFYVHRDLLIGKAQFVFWPHPFNGFIPNTSDMRRIK